MYDVCVCNTWCVCVCALGKPEESGSRSKVLIITAHPSSWSLCSMQVSSNGMHPIKDSPWGQKWISASYAFFLEIIASATTNDINALCVHVKTKTHLMFNACTIKTNVSYLLAVTFCTAFSCNVIRSTDILYSVVLRTLHAYVISVDPCFVRLFML